MKITQHEIKCLQRERRKTRQPGPVAKAAIDAGFNKTTIMKRMARGMTLEEALSMPVMLKSESLAKARDEKKGRRNED